MMMGMDGPQIMDTLGDGFGQFGLGGFNSPSGMQGKRQSPGGQGGWANALATFGQSMGNRQQRQPGEAPELPQQGGQFDIQALLEQLFHDGPKQGMGRGGYANFLGGGNVF